MAPRDILADLPPRQRPKNEIADLWDALQSYANRTGEHFMGGLEQNAQGFGDIYERGAVHTGIPRMAFGGLASLGAPVSAALEPLLSPYLAPAMQKMNEYVGKPIEASTGYPADLANEIALLPLGALGKVAKHAVPRLASMGDAIGNAFGPDMPLAGAVRGTFIGPMAKNFPKGLLNYAEKMVSEGNTPQEIFRSTGLFKGADGKWRKEIDDSVATMNFGDDNAPLHQPRSIKSVLQHKELYDNYPDLVNADVTKITGSGGQLQQAFDLLDIDDTPIHTNINVGDAAKLAADVPTKQSHQKGVLLHELQHYIQQREGWNRGGSTSDFTYQNSPLFDQRGSTESALDAYKRLAGEVEARNTQARRGLSKEDRAAMIPLLTEDVPRDRQIVHYGRAEPQSIDPKSPLSSSIRGSGPVPTKPQLSTGRAATGGQEGVNGYLYKGGQFLPSTDAPPGTYRIKSKGKAQNIANSNQLIEPGKTAGSPTPFARSIFTQMGGGTYVDIGPDGVAKVNPRINWEYLGFHPDSKTKSRFKNLAESSEAYSINDYIDMYNKGARWIDLEPLDGVEIVAKGDTPLSSAIRGSGPVPIAGKVDDVADAGITAYHGTPEKGVQRLSTSNAIETPGAVFASNRDDVAETFTQPREYGEPVLYDDAGNDIPRGEVLELRLTPKNVMNYPEADGQRFIEDSALQARAVKEAKAAGHDMIHVKNVKEGIGERMDGDVYVVLDDRIITILRRYGIPMTAGAGGAMMVAGQDMPPDIAAQMGGT